MSVLLAASLGGCASISSKMAEGMSQMPGIGMSADVPARPAQTAPYPAVHDMPAPRNSVLLTGVERQKLESDLVTARDQQQAEAKEDGAAPQPPPAPPPAAPAKRKASSR